MYENYIQKKFTVDGHEGTVICPQTLREDRAYIWRTEFLGAYDYADRELLKKGWFLVYYRISDQFGSPDAIQKMRNFQNYLEQEYGLKDKAVLFGFSRGGLYAVNYAAIYPEKVWKIYLDAPVLDLFSWPGGFGRGDGSPRDWEMCKSIFQIKEGDVDCPGNALHSITALIKNQIPILLVVGDSDTVVPFQENGKLLYADYKLAGAPIKCLIKKGVGHHPHSLEDPSEIVEWVSYDREFGCIIRRGAKDWQIFQQTDGQARIILEGKCVDYGSEATYNAFVRVVDEADGRPILPWRICQIDRDGWKIELEVPTGGLYRIESCMDLSENCSEWSKRGDCIRHIGVGDVFVIAGQSNSAGYGKDLITDIQELGIHLLKNSGTWDIAAHPMNDSTDTIHPQNRDMANTGQSPYLAFARYLKRVLGYPIGLVQAALGGSGINQWSPEGGELYQNLLNILHSVNGVKGILWYQGCFDAMCDGAGSYFESFARMIESIRLAEGCPTLPFFTFQLNRIQSRCTDEQSCGWGKVREVQRQAARSLRNVYIVPSIGGMMSDQIHNSSAANLVLGERMAKSVLGHLYGKSVDCDAPDLERAIRKDDYTIILEFIQVSSELVWYSQAARTQVFVAEGASERITPSDCRIIGKNIIELEFEKPLPEDCVVHGAAGADVICDLPMDGMTRMPMIAFYGAPVEKQA